VDDRESPEAEADAAVVVDPGVGAVGAAVRERLAHPRDELLHDRCALRVEAQGARDAAHQDTPRAVLLDVSRKLASTRAARSPARPSQRGIVAGSECAVSRSGIVTTRDGFSPSRVFVPCSRVIGRSVPLRSVKHGTPRADVSSWTPPESVRTNPARASRPTKS